jgi:hypothetical protein
MRNEWISIGASNGRLYINGNLIPSELASNRIEKPKPHLKPYRLIARLPYSKITHMNRIPHRGKPIQGHISGVAIWNWNPSPEQRALIYSGLG